MEGTVRYAMVTATATSTAQLLPATPFRPRATTGHGQFKVNLRCNPPVNRMGTGRALANHCTGLPNWSVSQCPVTGHLWGILPTYSTRLTHPDQPPCPGITRKGGPTDGGRYFVGTLPGIEALTALSV